MTATFASPLAVYLPGQHVGRLERSRSGLTVWTPERAWEQRNQRPRLGVAFLRTPGQRQAGTGLPPWFENLLPENGSALRERLCSTHGIRETDSFRLLRAIGADLSGAVEIMSSTEAPGEDDDASPTERDDDPAREASLSERLRFSLAGMQLKFSMSMANERLALGARGRGGQWIVKLPGYRYLELPEVECATMTWAKNAGFDVPKHFTVATDKLDGVPDSWWEGIPRAFAIERFDRRDDGSKIHQEDLCQAFELLPLHKYGDTGARRISLDGALRFVTDVAGEESGREMARRIGFVIACGNDDAHLKNWSLLWGNADRPNLTPCYDLVATVSWPDFHGWNTQRGPSLALKLGSERRFSRLNTFVLDRHVAASQCSWAKAEILAGIARARDAWAASQYEMPEIMRAALRTHWSNVPLLSDMIPASMAG